MSEESILIKGRVFMGNGSYTDAVLNHLRGRLEEAFIIIGGLQQPSHQPEEFDLTNDINDEVKVEVIAKEIYLALTGDIVTGVCSTEDSASLERE